MLIIENNGWCWYFNEYNIEINGVSDVYFEGIYVKNFVGLECVVFFIKYKCRNWKKVC